MENLKLGTYCFFTGLGMAFIVSAFSTLYHKWKRLNSFTLIVSTDEVMLKNTGLTSLLSSTSYFFILTCFTFFIGTNKYNATFQLIVIYSLCIVLAAINYSGRKKFKVLFNRMHRTVQIKSQTCSFENCTLEVALNRRWLNDDITSYGLYLVDKQMKHRLIYGYSIHKDIKKLHDDLTHLLNIS